MIDPERFQAVRFHAKSAPYLMPRGCPFVSGPSAHSGGARIGAPLCLWFQTGQAADLFLMAPTIAVNTAPATPPPAT
jgi:hypothetical protein